VPGEKSSPEQGTGWPRFPNLVIVPAFFTTIGLVLYHLRPP
jgi:hypothetical protein